MYGMVWTLDPTTGAEIWAFEPPLPHNFAPLKVVVYASYVLATNTSPLTLHTHVLHIQTGKELYRRSVAICSKSTPYAALVMWRDSNRMTKNANLPFHSCFAIS